MTTQPRTPLLDAVVGYARSHPGRFHVPGHKGNPETQSGLASAAQELGLLALDLTEVHGLDNLHAPSGVIAEAQRLAAAAFGSRECLFTVGGSTVGILGAILAAMSEGDEVLVPRDAHVSVINALVLSGAVPRFLIPDLDKHYGVSLGVGPGEVAKGLREHPDAGVVLVTYPTYHGFCTDIEAVVREVHAAGKLLIVDEAHGAHLAFATRPPVSAIDAGADIVVQSAHKMMPGMTGTGLVHRVTDSVPSHRLRVAVRMVQTTSPSYVLMASIDSARAFMALHYDADRLFDLSRRVRDEIASIPGLECPKLSGDGREDGVLIDPGKILIRTRALGVTGYDLAEAMARAGAVVEAADFHTVLVVLTVADDEVSCGKLIEAVKAAACNAAAGIAGPGREEGKSYRGTSVAVGIEAVSRMLAPGPMALSPRRAVLGPSRLAALSEAAGKVSAAPIGLYPPGFAAIWPGEVITEDKLAIIAAGAELGHDVIGLTQDGLVAVVEQRPSGGVFLGTTQDNR